MESSGEAHRSVSVHGCFPSTLRGAEQGWPGGEPRVGDDGMLLSVDNVSKTYLPSPLRLRLLVRTAIRAPVVALRSVSLGVRPGEVVGLIGPNGAGKTTLIRVISTLLQQTDGSVSVDGFDTVTAPSEVRRRLGLVLESDRGLYDRLSGFQNLEFFGVMSGLKPGPARRRAAELLEFVGLSRRDKLVFGYSAGMRARLSLARALISDPPLLVLDEPTRSLDPAASSRFVDALRGLADRSRGILLSSHRLDEVASVCSHVVVLIDGRVRHDAPAGRLSAATGATAASLAAFLARESNTS
jgi:ABC-2 type transport system ATP-binding protein